jgi:hypothetical protein
MKNRMDMIVETYARQAGMVYEVRPELNTWTAFDLELIEFSRLLVQECINACGSDSGTEMIRRHFGIEP